MDYKRFSYVPADGPKTPYEVGIAKSRPELIAAVQPLLLRLKKSSILYIVDKNLPVTYLKLVVEVTQCEAKHIVYLDPLTKTIDRILSLYDALVDVAPDMAIVIGGGTTGDLSGFACGSYQRGIPRIFFPTTTLSMIDASVGGKSGVDHRGSKNSLSILHYPTASLMYLPFLETLDPLEYQSGFAETVKLGVIKQPKLLPLLEKFLESKEKNLQQGLLADIIFSSAQTKAQICQLPAIERLSLLYGHAIGHGLETLGTTRRRHGDCVAIGMHIEGAMACVLGRWSLKEWQEQAALLQALHLDTKMPEGTALKMLLKKMRTYKKLNDEKHFLFSLPGSTTEDVKTSLVPVPKESMLTFLEETLAWITTHHYVRH